MLNKLSLISLSLGASWWASNIIGRAVWGMEFSFLLLVREQMRGIEEELEGEPATENEGHFITQSDYDLKTGHAMPCHAMQLS